MTDSVIPLKIVFGSRVLWVPIDSSAKVRDLLAKWGQRIGIQDVSKYTLHLNEGELFEEDSLKTLQIQQRETLHVQLVKVSYYPQTISSQSERFSFPDSHIKDEPPKFLPTTQILSPNETKNISIPSSTPTPTPTRIPSSGFPTSSKLSQFFYHSDSQKTIKPIKSMDNLSAKKLALRDQAINSLQNIENLKQVVKLPSGQIENDWITLHVIAFFNNSNIIYSKFVHSCTSENCPHTTAGQQNYLWMDAVKKMPVDIPAPEYFSNLFEWILKDNLNDESKFPPLTSDDAPYPTNFFSVAADISRRIFRVYAHLYHQHYSEIAENLIMQLDIFEKCFELFYHFVTEFKLVSESDLKPMESLINIINL